MSKRIGLIVPSSNTVAEVDFYRRLPANCALHTARMYLEVTTPDAEAAMLDDHLPTAIADLATARPDVVVFGCTSAGALRGNEYEASLIKRISERTGAATVSVAASVRLAIRAKRPRTVGVITPYVDSLNEKICESLEADGLAVSAIHGLGIADNFTIGQVEPERIARFAFERFGHTDIDLVFASCTNFRALEARQEMQQKLGVPVVTSNQAALAAALQQI